MESMDIVERTLELFNRGETFRSVQLLNYVSMVSTYDNFDFLHISEFPQTQLGT